jgi:hypothetical protein
VSSFDGMNFDGEFLWLGSFYGKFLKRLAMEVKQNDCMHIGCLLKIVKMLFVFCVAGDLGGEKDHENLLLPA